jgi:hypothetical protein
VNFASLTIFAGSEGRYNQFAILQTIACANRPNRPLLVKGVSTMQYSNRSRPEHVFTFLSNSVLPSLIIIFDSTIAPALVPATIKSSSLMYLS